MLFGLIRARNRCSSLYEWAVVLRWIVLTVILLYCLNFHFPMHWDWLKWFQVLKSTKSLHYWPYCHFCLMVQASISLWLLESFPNRSTYHVHVPRDTYLYINFEKHIWSFSLLFLQSVLDVHHLVFVDCVPYPSYKFDGAKFLESRKSSFRFLCSFAHWPG